MSCSLVPSYNEMVKSAQDRDTSDLILLYGVISAIFNASYNAGEGIGPLVSGLLMTYVNFEVTQFPIIKIKEEVYFLQNILKNHFTMICI